MRIAHLSLCREVGQIHVYAHAPLPATVLSFRCGTSIPKYAYLPSCPIRHSRKAERVLV